jgi:hypothetical protein
MERQDGAAIPRRKWGPGKRLQWRAPRALLTTEGGRRHGERAAGEVESAAPGNDIERSGDGT